MKMLFRKGMFWITSLLILGLTFSHTVIAAPYDWGYVQFQNRIYEDASRNHFRLGWSFKDQTTGFPILTDNLNSIALYRSGTPVNLAPYQFMVYGETQMVYNVYGSYNWNPTVQQIGWYRTAILEPPVLNDLYEAVADLNDPSDPTFQQTLSIQGPWLGYVNLPMISSAGFRKQIHTDGSVTISWNGLQTNQLANVDRVSGWLWAGGKEVNFQLFDPTESSIRIDASAVNWLGGDLSQIVFGMKIDSDTLDNGIYYNQNRTISNEVALADIQPVPLPAAAWLIGSGLLGLMVVRHRTKK